MKTRNLTQSSLRNDLINRRMHGFSFWVFENEIEVQDVISPLSFDQSLISSSLWMWKCIKNTRNQMAHEMGVWTVRISWNFKGPFFRHEELNLKRKFLGVTVGWRGASRSAVAMKRLLIESSWLSPIRPISDEGPRWVHVSLFETSRRLIFYWILIQRSWCVGEFTDHARSHLL